MNNSASNISELDAVQATLFQFWSGFGIPAFLMNFVPKGQSYPYLAFTMSGAGMFEQTEETAVIWTYSESFVELNALTQAVFNEFPSQGLLVSLNDGLGAIRLSRGTPFTQNYRHENTMVKAKVINYRLNCYLK